MNKITKIALASIGILAVAGTAAWYVADDEYAPPPRAKKHAMKSESRIGPEGRGPEMQSPEMEKRRYAPAPRAGGTGATERKPQGVSRDNSTVAVSIPNEESPGGATKSVPKKAEVPVASNSAALPKEKSAVPVRMAAYYGVERAGAKASGSTGSKERTGFLFDYQLKQTLTRAVDELVQERVQEIEKKAKAGKSSSAGGAESDKEVLGGKEQEPRVVKGKLVELHKIPTVMYFSSREVIGGKVALITDTGLSIARGVSYSGGKIVSIDRSSIYLEIGGKRYPIPYIITYGDSSHPMPSYRTIRVEKEYRKKIGGKNKEEEGKVVSVVYKGLDGEGGSARNGAFGGGESTAELSGTAKENKPEVYPVTPSGK